MERYKFHPVCYFYIDENGVIDYVGKSNKLLNERIRCHSKENRFIVTQKKYTIKYVIFDNATDMDEAERCLIKSFKPMLNTTNNTKGFFPKAILNEEDLILYGEIDFSKIKPKRYSQTCYVFKNGKEFLDVLNAICSMSKTRCAVELKRERYSFFSLKTELNAVRKIIHHCGIDSFEIRLSQRRNRICFSSIEDHALMIRKIMTPFRDAFVAGYIDLPYFRKLYEDNVDISAEIAKISKFTS